MLTLIGLGICADLTLQGRKLAKKSEEVYAELYTGILPDGWIKKIEKVIGKKISILEREVVESDFLVKRAKEKNVALLVPGDPLVATTHTILLLDAQKAGIEIKVVHNSSIFTAAAGKAGLQHYKFGKTATFTYWRKNYEPVSALEIIEENQKVGLHTLVLLDLDKTLGPMDAKTAFAQIAQMENKLGRKVVNQLVVLSRVGWKEEKISYGTIAELAKKDLGKPPFCFIVPGKLHFVEEENLRAYSSP